MVSGTLRTASAGRTSPEASATETPALTCSHLSAVYPGRQGDVQALRDIGFSIRDREFVSIVGPSGCGKSTLLRIIAGLQQPTAGSVSFGGASRPGTGLVFQEHGTFPWMTVVENLAFGLEMQGMPRDERQARALDYANRLGLGQFVHAFPRELSVGMRQRVDIGRAFLSGAPLLLMDEPFGALDAQTRWVLQEELLRIWLESRKLVVFVTHDLDEAVLLSDRVLVMSGRPGTIRQDVSIDLPRPRDSRRDHAAIREYTWHMWQLLEPDVRSGLAIKG